ncbi:MAG: O-methyltransferase [Methylobacter sp.]
MMNTFHSDTPSPISSLDIAPVCRLADGAITFLTEFLAQKRPYAPSILEFGMGGSTLWFSQQNCKLVSVEHNPAWFEAVKAVIQPDHVELILHPIPLHDICSTFADANFDLILIDHEDFDEGRMRLACLQECRRLVKPGGILMLDNTDRSKFAPAYGMMQDWPAESATQIQTKNGYNRNSSTSWWRCPQ